MPSVHFFSAPMYFFLECAHTNFFYASEASHGLHLDFGYGHVTGTGRREWSYSGGWQENFPVFTNLFFVQ